MSATEIRTLDPDRSSVPGIEPALVLSFPDGGCGASQRRTIPAEGLLVGREVQIFEDPFDDPGLSRRHAELRVEGDRVVLRDLGSRQGTRLNGEMLSGEHVLSPGDVMRLGDTLLVFAPATEGCEAHEHELIGAGAAMVAVRRSIDLIASHAHTVVISGETGTGKEITARLIHQRSERGGPFLAVNCSLLSESLLASDLFGHVGGAFAGAASEPGLFRAARGGTLLLDELGELPLSLQSSLLRVLETREIRPVGGSCDVSVDVRIIGTTNTGLDELMALGRFRADLYARLAQWHIRMPPLRDHRDDIPALTMNLLGRCKGSGRRLSPDLAEALLINPWPLNVRGLLNVLSTAVLTSPRMGPLTITLEVQEGLGTQQVRPREPLPESPVDPGHVDLGDLMSRFQGKVTSAARSIGVSRPRLYRMLWAADLDPASFRKR